MQTGTDWLSCMEGFSPVRGVRGGGIRILSGEGEVQCTTYIQCRQTFKLAGLSGPWTCQDTRQAARLFQLCLHVGLRVQFACIHFTNRNSLSFENTMVILEPE